MIDVVLLRIIRKRKDFMLLRPMVSASVLDAKTNALIEDYEKYFQKYPSHLEIDMATFLPAFKRWHPDMSNELFNGYVAVLKNCMQEADDDQRRNMVEWLAETELMTKLANLAEEHNNGELADCFAAVETARDAYRHRIGVKTTSFIDTPIGDLLKEEFDDTGVSWRLDCLNGSMRRLRPGDFGIIAGRPDKGKTSFIASEITHFARQLPPERNILWLNNEGPGRRIIPRLYQAALDLSMSEMKAMSNAGTLIPAYREAMGGRLDRVRIFDIHGKTNSQVEMIIEDNNAGVIVYDMIDNIRGFGDAARTDLQLEAMYQWARERSVKYDCIGLATSQISNDGEGVMYPTMNMLKDSKTGKQGACDFQIMIGASNDPTYAGSRFLGVVKNKLRKPEGQADPRCEVIFDGLKSRYRDIPIQ